MLFGQLLQRVVGAREIHPGEGLAIGDLRERHRFEHVGSGLDARGLGAVFDRGESPDLSLIREPQVIGPILGLCALAALPIILRALKREP